MITDHISNNKIRNAYIERVDRKQAFEKLKLMSNPVQMNEHQKVKIKIYSDSDDISSINSIRQIDLIVCRCINYSKSFFA